MIDERIKFALQDLEGEMRAGHDFEASLFEIAHEYEFQPEILRVRAEHAFGDLEAASQRLQQWAEIDRLEQELRTQAYEFANSHFETNNPLMNLSERIADFNQRRGLSFSDIICAQTWANFTFKSEAQQMKARSHATARLRQLYREKNFAQN